MASWSGGSGRGYVTPTYPTLGEFLIGFKGLATAVVFRCFRKTNNAYAYLFKNNNSSFLSHYLFCQLVLCGPIQVALMASKMTKDAGGER